MSRLKPTGWETGGAAVPCTLPSNRQRNAMQVKRSECRSVIRVASMVVVKGMTEASGGDHPCREVAARINPAARQRRIRVANETLQHGEGPKARNCASAAAGPNQN